MLKGKTAVVTGATGGLGKIVVRELLTNGARVAAMARRPQDLTETTPIAESIYRGYAADLTDETGVTAAFQAVQQDFGGIDLLVHLLGGYHGGTTVKDTPLSTWRQMMELNLNSAFLCCRAAMQRMAGGKIVAVAAETALAPRTGVAAYAAAKAGLIALVQAIAEEGKSINIQANVLAPGIILTEANRRAMPKADFGKWVTPDQIAQTIIFLCSPQADGVTGSVIRMPTR